MEYFLSIIFIVYITFTLRFVIKFNRTNTQFTRNQKLIHNVLFWLIPFFWIITIKIMTSPTPGSHNYNDKDEDKGFYESGLGG